MSQPSNSNFMFMTELVYITIVFFINTYLSVSVCVWVCTHAHTKYRGPWRPEEGIRPLVTEVTGICEPFYQSAVN